MSNLRNKYNHFPYTISNMEAYIGSGDPVRRSETWTPESFCMKNSALPLASIIAQYGWTLAQQNTVRTWKQPLEDPR